MDNQDIDALQRLVPKLVNDPTLLSDPLIDFFCDYIESLGGKIPESAWDTDAGTQNSWAVDTHNYINEAEDATESYNVVEEEEEEEPEIVESDIELDESYVVEPDNDPPQKMGDSSIEVTEENRNASQEAEIQAMKAIYEDKFEEAVEHLTMAILLNPKSAIMYETRASVYIKMKKPNAATQDAIAALKINPNSAKGYKSRGIAQAMLGQWEEAVKDLHKASKLDNDEEIIVALDKVWSNAHKVEEHRRKYERLRREERYKKFERNQVRRRFQARAAYLKNNKQEQSSSSGSQGGMLGGFTEYNKNEAELMATFNDPEVIGALLDVMVNPASLAKHQASPKVAAVISTILTKFLGLK